MPVRLALTGRTSGPDIGEQLKLVGLSTAAGVTTGVVGMEERIKVLSEINVKVQERGWEDTEDGDGDGDGGDRLSLPLLFCDNYGM